MMWTAAAPKTAGDKSRPWALPADNHSVLLRAGPHMPGRAAPSKISLPHTHPSSQSCRGGCDDIIHKQGGHGGGLGGLFSQKYELEGKKPGRCILVFLGHLLPFVLLFNSFHTFSSCFTLFDLELWPLFSHQNVSQGEQHLQKTVTWPDRPGDQQTEGPAHHSTPGNKSHCICILIFHINKGPEYSLGQHHWTNLIRNEKFIGPSLMRLMLS